MHPDWIVPDWPAPAGVHAVCTTRAGGQSAAPYDSFNLGDHVGDAADHVAANRAELARALGARPAFLAQVHGTDAVEIDATTVPGTRADACWTTQAGVACTIMVADCLPVLLTHARGGVVAAAHAGWRGLAGQGKQGVLEQIFERFEATALARHGLGATEIVANQTLAWLGPCIGPTRFEVGEDVRHAFVVADRQQPDPHAADLFQPLGRDKWLADLAGLARLRLQALGIRQIYGNDGSPDWCTVGNPLRFFSHRRDALALGGSGRMAACVWLD